MVTSNDFSWSTTNNRSNISAEGQNTTPRQRRIAWRRYFETGSECGLPSECTANVSRREHHVDQFRGGMNIRLEQDVGAMKFDGLAR